MMASRRRSMMIFVSVALVISLVANAFLAYTLLKGNKPSNNPGFELVSPQLSEMSRDEFLSIQRYYRSNYFELKDKIIKDMDPKLGQDYAFYFESLNSGAWIGIREKEKFLPGSLRKVPLMAAAMKKIEEGSLSLETPVTVLKEDLDPSYGNLASKGYGYTMSVKDVIHHMAYYSDNTAAMVMQRVVGEDRYWDAVLGLGLSYLTAKENLDVSNYPLSAKEYSNVLRSLYYSNYLLRVDSQFILSELSDTRFNDGIPAGVPKGVKVAHKVGYWSDGNQHHDCGIVYFPNNPYILCIMTHGLSEADSNKVIGEASKTVYEFVSKE